MNARFSLLFAAMCTSAFAQEPTSWTSELSMQVKTVAEVVPSPDGSRVAWTQTEAVMDGERSTTLTHIFVANADGSERIQLTRGDSSARSPSFSPDGRYVFFISSRSGRNNVYRIAIGGEAEMLTDFNGILFFYEVSPDGRTMGFRGYEPPASQEQNRRQKSDWRVMGANAANSSLYFIPVETGSDGTRTQRKLTDGRRHVMGTFHWSPDSQAIAFSHRLTPDARDGSTRDISEVDLDGTIKAITATEANEIEPSYSADGRYLAYGALPARLEVAGEERIILVTRATGEKRTLQATYGELYLDLIGWTADSRLLFATNKRTRRAVFAMPVNGPPQVVFEPAKGWLSGDDILLNARGTHLGLAMETPDDPPEAYVLRLAGGEPARLSAANVNLPKLDLGRTEIIRWKSKDGLEIEGLLTYPVNYQAGRRYPLVLAIHGGPDAAAGETFIGGYPFAAIGGHPYATLTTSGYAVLQPNPRGSTGYGKAFRSALYKKGGTTDYDDNQAGVDHVIAMGVADPGRLAVVGYSYGGYMTAWTITRTQRFKAAVIGAGISNLVSDEGNPGDLPEGLPEWVGDEQSRRLDFYRKHSPISYVQNVNTPTLILHGEADVQVPISQAYEMYFALKRQGVPVEMVVFPRQGHTFQEPKMELEFRRRLHDWVAKYLGQ